MEKTLYLKDENGDVFAILNGGKRRETLLSVRERLGCKAYVTLSRIIGAGPKN